MKDANCVLIVGIRVGDWKPYLNDRLIREDQTGFFVIVPEGAEPPVPLSCSVCSRLMRSRDDEAAHHEFGCCHLCALQWAHPRRKEWKDGWRPDEEQVRVAVEQRPPMHIAFDVD